MTEIVLSCGGPKCCPIIKFERKYITIEDDYGGKIKLTKKQYAMIVGKSCRKSCKELQQMCKKGE